MLWSFGSRETTKSSKGVRVLAMFGLLLDSIWTSVSRLFRNYLLDLFILIGACSCSLASNSWFLHFLLNES